jgi:4-amino-4-deoxy-L-arabinose transferase-like glycosyltransferase
VLPLVGLAAAAVLFRRLGATSLRNWDEATYAQVAKEIVQGGDWLTFHYVWEPWLEKPPLYLWSVAASFSLFGITEFSARLVAATAGLALVLVVFRITELLYDRTSAILAVAILLTTVMFVQSARSVMLDTPLTLCIYLAVFGYLRARPGSGHWWYSTGAALGLGVLVKGAAALVGAAALGFAAVLDRRGAGLLRSRPFWGGVVAAILLVVPWHLAMYLRHGEAFLDMYVRHHTVNRLTQAIVVNSGGPWYYLEQLLERCSPWVYLYPAALLVEAGVLRRRRHSSVLLAVVLVVLVLYTVARTRIWWYVVPATPGLAMLTGAFLATLWRLPAQGRSRHLVRAALAATFLVLLALGLQQIRVLQRPYTLPEAALGRLARSSGRADRDPIIAYRGVQTPTLTYYSERPVWEMWAPDGLPGVLAEGCGRRIVLLAEDTSRLGAVYDLRVLARDAELAYGTIAARSTGQPEGPCATR